MGQRINVQEHMSLRQRVSCTADIDSQANTSGSFLIIEVKPSRDLPF